MRQKILFEKLAMDASCIWYGVDALKGSDGETDSLEQAIVETENLLLPIPMCKGDGLNIQQKDLEISKNTLLRYIRKGQRIFAGCIDEAWKQEAEEKGAQCLDYMQEKTIAIYNSIATAEGTIAEIIRTHPKNLQGENVLVLGFGTCAKTLAAKLKALDADVTIAARREDALMEAYVHGYRTVALDKLTDIIGYYYLIVNTIPSRILTKPLLEGIQKDAMLYEIASAPYSFEEEEVKAQGITYIICPALPAKYAPVSSAEMLKRFIEDKQ